MIGRERVGHRRDMGGRDQHPGLDRIRADIGKHMRDLRRDDTGRHDMDAVNALRVLHRHRGDRGHGIGAEHGRGLDVGLDAGAAARIRTRDGEKTGWRAGGG